MIKIRGKVIGLVCILILNSVSIVKANQQVDNSNIEMGVYNNVDDIKEIYSLTANNLGLKYEYVQTVADIAGNSIVYANSISSAYTDTTIESLPSAFDIGGIIQIYDKKAPYINEEEISIYNIERPSKYYIPDASYNVMSSIKAIMDNRRTIDRGKMGIYFEYMTSEAKENLLFYEAVLDYLNYSDTIINNFSAMYIDILNSKEIGEYIISYKDNRYSISDKYIAILDRYNIPNERNIALLLSYDSLIVSNNNIASIQDEMMIPYKVGYTTRENMMLAATSLVGKVRYVWGGGHGGTSNINGINPLWFSFNELYNSTNRDACISPDDTWCPMHNTTRCDSLSDIIVHNIDEYLSLREPYIKDTDAYKLIENKNIEEIFNTREFSLPAHRFDGLDCSGYVSWIYNQIDPIRRYDSAARYFIQSSGLKEIEFGDKLLAGDVIAWDTHICMVIGAINSNNKVYTIIEATPNVVAFGTAYYPDASYKDIELGKQIAKEANSLFGNLDEVGSIYNLSKLEYVTEYIKNPEYTNIIETEDINIETEDINTETEDINIEIEDTNMETEDTSIEIEDTNIETEDTSIEEYITINRKALHIGRLDRVYLDEDKLIKEFNRSINNMTSQEIIQNVINNIPKEYLIGAYKYNGEKFNIK